MGEELLGLGLYVSEIVFLSPLLIKYCMSVLLLISLALAWMTDLLSIFFPDAVTANEAPSKIKARLSALSVFAESQGLTGLVSFLAVMSAIS